MGIERCAKNVEFPEETACQRDADQRKQEDFIMAAVRGWSCPGQTVFELQVAFALTRNVGDNGEGSQFIRA